MTTWHERETLDEVFAFTHEWARPYEQNLQLENVLLLHLAATDKADEFMQRYKAATPIS